MKQLVLVFSLFLYVHLFAQPCLVRFTSLSENQTYSTCNYKEFKYTLSDPNYKGFQWFYGDGNTCNCNKPKNFYVKNDSFKLMGIVTDSNGCKDTIAMSVIVNCANPCTLSPIGVHSADTLSYACNEVEFSARVSDNTKTATWFFGDKDSVVDVFAVHTYRKKGIYKAYIIAKDSQNCADTVRFDIQILCDEDTSKVKCSLKILNIDSIATGKCLDKKLSASANDLFAETNWQMNDGLKFKGVAVQDFKFLDSGWQKICVWIVDSNLCKDSLCVNWYLKCPSKAVGIFDNGFYEKKMFPNPSNGIFYFEDKEIKTARVFNIMGIEVAAIVEKNERVSIDLQHLPNGIYFCLIDGKTAYNLILQK